MPEVHASEVVLEGVNEGELDVEFVLLITAIIVLLNHVDDLLFQASEVSLLEELLAQPAAL